ncbi:uncharacterized protein N0V89_001363 [Didymosphaeria variabile]|uniref:Uncharacterized protein n=1 Tax=Didymosphaeria variabile TaxID=1932322 RepID=A0A9W8XWX2_9PLEO|nr:uncharacterized protein N0V89_001363 [Didymosphaeria variabile]KAJ4360796.1 hypothetical protein N0V89_001363 [Didymosphaeria variabile]
MATSLIERNTANSPSHFTQGWCSLPAELRLQILSYVLTIDKDDFEGHRITAYDYMAANEAYKYLYDSAYLGRFAEIALPLLACPRIDEVFNMRKAALDVWYGKNTFQLGGHNYQSGEKLAFSYLVPNRNAFAHLQHVEAYIRGDYVGWKDLASYCKATKDMPMLKVFEVEFILLRDIDEDSKTLDQAFTEIGPLIVSAQKFVIECRCIGQLLGEIRPPTQLDRVDYPEAASVFENISIEASGGKAAKEKFARYWHDYMKKVEVDEVWALPPTSQYAWHKRMVRTQWQ